MDIIFFNLDTDLKLKLAQSVLVVAVFYLLKLITIKYFIKNLSNSKSRYRWQKAISIITNILVFIIILRLWFEGVDSLATYFGFLTAGLAIALKDLIANFAGSLFIVSRHPFDIGDRIQIGEHRGDVIDIRLFQFTLLEIGEWTNSDNTTGRVIHIPCGKVFTESQINYNQAFSHIWNELTMTITFESDWNAAKLILNEILQKPKFKENSLTPDQLRESSLKFMLPIESFDSKVLTYVVENGIRLIVRYLCEPKKRRRTEVELWEEIITAFQKAENVKFAYPTQRFYSDTKLLQ